MAARKFVGFYEGTERKMTRLVVEKCEQTQLLDALQFLVFWLKIPRNVLNWRWEITQKFGFPTSVEKRVLLGSNRAILQ